MIYHRPSIADRCDVCGGRLIPRADDTSAAVRERLHEYHVKTEPILELFREKGLVIAVDGTKPPNEVQQAIRERFGLTRKV